MCGVTTVSGPDPLDHRICWITASAESVARSCRNVIHLCRKSSRCRQGVGASGSLCLDWPAGPREPRRRDGGARRAGLARGVELVRRRAVRRAPHRVVLPVRPAVALRARPAVAQSRRPRHRARRDQEAASSAGVRPSPPQDPPRVRQPPRAARGPPGRPPRPQERAPSPPPRIRVGSAVARLAVARLVVARLALAPVPRGVPSRVQPVPPAGRRRPSDDKTASGRLSPPRRQQPRPGLRRPSAAAASRSTPNRRRSMTCGNAPRRTSSPQNASAASSTM